MRSTSMLPVVLRRAYHALAGFLEDGLARQGMSMPDFTILEALLHKGPLPAGTLEAKVMRLADTPMRPAVERLRRRGLIRTFPERNASRKEILDLSVEGRRRIAAIYRAHAKEIDAVFGALSRREREALRRSLRTIGLRSEAFLRLRSMTRKGGLAPWQIRRVTEYMAQHVADTVRLKDLASRTGLSPSRFGRAFKASMGVPPHQWQIRLRIRQAQDLLREEDSSLAEIALAAGFTEQSHFSRVFKEVIGVSPGAWRRAHRL